MKLFIESADVEKIKEAWGWGILDGVVITPALAAQTGRKPGELFREISVAVDCPVCIETAAIALKDITLEARALARLGRNLLFKVHLTKESLKAVQRLEAESIKTIVAVTFSPLQALLAAKVNASYVSLQIGLLEETGQSAIEVVRRIKTIYKNYSFTTQVIAAGVQQPLSVLEAALAGADVSTVSFEVLGQLYQHLLTLSAAAPPTMKMHPAGP